MKAITYVPIIALLLALAGLGFWFLQPAPDVGGMGVPIPKPKASLKDEQMSLSGVLKKGSAEPSELTGEWAQFRGPKLSSKIEDSRSLLESWPETGPQKVWQIELSKGHGGAVVHKGRAYILDYNTETLEDVIRCLNFETSKEIWSYAYPVKTKNNHGITRSVPAVNDDYVVTLGPKAQVYCLNAKTGEFVWNKSLVLEYETEIPKWYSGQCPLMVANNKVIIAPCGPKGFVIQVDCATGKVDWTAENKMRWDMTHTSVTPMTLKGGKQTYVYSGSGGVAGVDAENGEVLWVNREWKIKIAACASPLVIDEERVFLSAGYSAGCMMIRVFKDDKGEWGSKEMFSLLESKFGSVQHTPILHEGHIYGTRPNGELVCLDLEGKIKWESGVSKFGIGPYMMVQDKMFLLDSKTCDLSMVEINPESYKEMAKVNLWEGHDAYGLMAYVHGLLIVRDLKYMAALDITQDGFKKVL